MQCSETCSLIDHFVGAGEHARRQLKTERLGGLKIDNEFVLGWRLHRQVGRLLAIEDAIDVGRCGVCCSSDAVVGVLCETMRSGCCATSSFANRCIASASSAAHRVSIRML